MLKSFLDILLHSNNQFMSGGFVLMAVGAVVAVLKGLPKKIYDAVYHQITVSLTISDDSYAMEWFKSWYITHPHSKRNRQMDVHAPHHDSAPSLILAPGSHWVWYKRRPFRIDFNRKDPTKDGNGGGGGSMSKIAPESLSVHTFGRKQSVFIDLVNEMKRVYDEKTAKKKRLFVWHSSWGSWESLDFMPRPLDSVILPHDQKQHVISDITYFIGARSWYEGLGIPYHRGYLLYGPPGTGKSSFISGLAAHFDRPLYMLQLAEMLNSNDFKSAINHLPQNAFVVLEDIDCVTKRRPEREDDDDEKEENGDTSLPVDHCMIPLSTLLNALDGLTAAPGVVFFMTTNFIEKLDAALIRPGRVDMRIFIDKATDEQKTELYWRFFPEDSSEMVDAFIERNNCETLAEFQGMLLEERNIRIQNPRMELVRTVDWVREEDFD